MYHILFCCSDVDGFVRASGLSYAFEGKYYETQAKDLQQRERKIKAARGKILDRNGVVLADNKSVCTISVIHNQIKEPEAVISMLVKELGIRKKRSVSG